MTLSGTRNALLRSVSLLGAVAILCVLSCTPPPTNGRDACVPTTCAALGIQCGSIDDGCNAMLDCGGCTEGLTCGGGGVSHVCGANHRGACSSDGWCRDVSLQGVRNLTATWGAASNDVWAVGANGVIAHWEGERWTDVASGLTAIPDAGIPGSLPALNSVWGSSGQDVWAVGAAGTIIRWDGTRWNSVASGTTSDLGAVWGSAANDVWAVGAGGVALHWNGTSWMPSTSNVAVALFALWGNAANSVWAVGERGTAIRWDGTSWTAQTTGVRVALRGVWGSSASDVWTVGDRGSLAHYDGMAWTITMLTYPNVPDGGMPLRITEALSSVWGSGPTDVYAAGLFGTAENRSILLRWNGMTWSFVDSGTTEDLKGIWGSGPNDIWIVGSFAALLHRGQSAN